MLRPAQIVSLILIPGIIPGMDKRVAFDTLIARVAKGELAFPTSAQVALKLRQTLDNPDCHIEAVTRLVQAEPLLAARVVATANSVAYNRSDSEISDVRQAVARLGFRTVRTLAMALVTRQMAGQPSAKAHQELACRLWEHTAHVASLAQVIARHVTHQDPETALFSGIVHEIGGFYLISCADEFPGLIDNDFSDWIDGGESAVGSAVLGVLDAPETVVAAMRGYWDGYLAMPPLTLSDTLLLAEELAPVASPLHHLQSDDAAQGLAAQIEMVVGKELLSHILRESADEVRSLTEALKI